MMNLDSLRTLLNQLYANLPKRSVLIAFGTYAFGSVLLRGISIIILPLIMRQLTPVDYGVLSLATAFITIGTALIGLGLRQVLSLEYFHHHGRERAHLITEILIIYTVIAIPISIMSWQMRSLFIRFLFFESITELQLLAIYIQLFLFFYAELLYQLLQYAQQARLLTLIQMLIALLTSGGTLYAVWYLHAGITGVLWAQCIAQITGSSIAFFYFFTRIYCPPAVKTATKKIGYYLRYGAPFIPGIMCSWILASSDRWMLGYFCSMQEVGMYAVADLFAQIFNSVILVPWSGSYLPYIMQRYKQNELSLPQTERINQQVMWVSLALLAFVIMLGLSIGKPLLYWILPPAYHPAASYVSILLFGQLCLLGSYFSSSLIQFKKRTLFLALALALPAALNILLNAVLIPFWGIYGCSFATLLSYAIYFMITYHYNRIICKRIINEVHPASSSVFKHHSHAATTR